MVTEAVQVNQVTSHLDASLVYGSEPCLARQLRRPAPGHTHLLRTSHPGRRGGALLPLAGGVADCRAVGGLCFLAGDERWGGAGLVLAELTLVFRVNEQPGLVVGHTLLLRLHNQLAAQLQLLNPSWGGERVYQEARRLVAALLQHVTFAEFLPRVLGISTTRTWGLSLLDRGYYEEYRQTALNKHEIF